MVGLIADELGSNRCKVKNAVHTLGCPHPFPDLCDTLLVGRTIVTPPLNREFREDVKGNPIDSVPSLNIAGCIVAKVVLEIRHWRRRRWSRDRIRFLHRSDVVPVIVAVLHWKRKAWAR
jgi:hypothetical protein